MSTSSGAGSVASALVATLERAWATIVANHPEVPAVVVVVAPGSGGRVRELKLGHFAAGRWEVEGGQRCELLVGGEGLRLGAVEVLGTLLHEAAHGLGWSRGIQNTSRGGRYHNRRYKALAEELGLDVAQVGAIGWSDTTVQEATVVRYAATLAEIEAALVLWRRIEAGSSTGGAAGATCWPVGARAGAGSGWPGPPWLRGRWCARCARGRLLRPRRTRRREAEALGEDVTAAG